jgi:uncharacterized protein (TIGR03083 family)
MMSVSQPPVQDWTHALRGSHERLVALLAPLDAEALDGPSYDPGWTVAQVASHLGSSAEIFGSFLHAGLTGTPPPGPEAFAPIWDTWNARSGVEARDAAIAADQTLVASFESATDAEQGAFELSMFGMNPDFVGLAKMRLAEHAVHTWDIAVALDPEALVAPQPVAMLVDGLTQTAARSGKAASEPFSVLLLAADLDRAFLLTAAETASLEPAARDAIADGTVTLPAEALLRLVYGRLDPGHTPSSVVESGAKGLADVRRVFQGF